LEKVDDDELKSMTSSMFQSSVSRRWWGRVREKWIGIHARPRRRHFLSIVNNEFRAAEVRHRAEPGPPVPAAGVSNAGSAALVLLGAAGIGLGYLYRRRITSSRRSAMNERQDVTG
jgi:hypothetical protein